MPLLEQTDRGLYCAAGDFYLDPWRPVDYAVITHAHSDHARWGSKHYLCHSHTAPLLRLRLGPVSVQAIPWGETVVRHGVEITLFPAGHIIGSSQVRVSFRGETWVFSGDYKTTPDGVSGQFEPVRCHCFITECTFGLPVYQWAPQPAVASSIQRWIIDNHQQGNTSVLLAYSLGKAQRLLPFLAATGLTIYTHGAVAAVQDCLEAAGIPQPPTKHLNAQVVRQDIAGHIVLAPPGVLESNWLKRIPKTRTATCSGWMAVRGQAKRYPTDRGFALSDHADWNELTQAIAETGATQVLTTHGFTAIFTRYLRDLGYDAHELHTQSGQEEDITTITDTTA
jgi:putative mRNA 3-end processing factor